MKSEAEIKVKMKEFEALVRDIMNTPLEKEDSVKMISYGSIIGTLEWVLSKDEK